MRSFNRTDRVGQKIAKQLALLLHQEQAEHRFGLVSVSEVKVARDLSFAKIYVRSLGVEDTKVIKELNQAKSYLRSQLAQTMNMRHMPELKFVYDHSIEQSERIEELLNRDKTDLTDENN